MWNYRVWLVNPVKVLLLNKCRMNHLTNRFQVAVHLFSNRSQMTSKCGKLEQKSGTGGAAECVTDVLTTFWLPLWSIKPGFHMIVRIIPTVPVVSKNFETIGTTEMIADFHMIVSITSNTEDVRSSAMFLGLTTEFWRDIRKWNGGHQS